MITWSLSMVLRFSLNLNFLWGWKCLSVHRGDSPLDKDPPPGQIPPEQRTPHLEGTWAQTGSEIIHPSWKEHGTRQEVTSYTSLVWYLVVATAAVGTHPTGMHSRFICKHFPKTTQKCIAIPNQPISCLKYIPKSVSKNSTPAVSMQIICKKLFR